MKKFISFFLFTALLCLAVSCNKEQLEEASITVSVSELPVGSNGEKTTVSVTSNRDWEAKADVEWITLSPASGSASDVASYIIVSVTPNEGAERTATITVSSVQGDASASVKVIQGENGLIIKNAEEFVSYLNLVIKGEASSEYKIGADLDLTDVTLPKVETFNYVLDGQTHIIKNWTSSASMFGTISATGAVKNLILDSSCKLTVPTDAENIGFIADVNNGTIQNVENRADITITATSAGRKGAICGVNNAYIEGCKNSGRISFTGQNAASGSAYYAGIAGQVTSETAIMENCTNTGIISFTFNESISQSFYIAGVVGCVNANAKALKCTNEGNITLRTTGSSSFAMAGGITTYSGGEVSNCTNSGNISYYAESAEGAADGAVKGTGVAGIATYEGWNEGTVTGNTNSGNITMRAGYSTGTQTSGSARLYATNVAGVFAHMFNCKVENCDNSGTVTAHLGDISNSAATLSTNFRQSVAGIVASSWGNITDCENTGTVVATYVTKDRTAVTGNRVYQVGGISGGDYHVNYSSESGNTANNQRATSIKGCINKGNINFTCDAAGPNNSVGGIVGWPHAEGNTALSASDCENTGAITVEGGSVVRVGGIAGGITNHVNNINRGAININGCSSNSTVGGIAGVIGASRDVASGCKSFGDITCAVKLAGSQGGTSGGIGGIAGASFNYADLTMTGDIVKCKITAPEGSTASILIGVVGSNRSNSDRVTTIGTSTNPMVIAGGILKLGDNGITVTADNYLTYALPWGTGTSVNTNVTSNVKFDASAAN